MKQSGAKRDRTFTRSNDYLLRETHARPRKKKEMKETEQWNYINIYTFKRVYFCTDISHFKPFSLTFVLSSRLKVWKQKISLVRRKEILWFEKWAFRRYETI